MVSSNIGLDLEVLLKSSDIEIIAVDPFKDVDLLVDDNHEIMASNRIGTIDRVENSTPIFTGQTCEKFDQNHCDDIFSLVKIRSCSQNEQTKSSSLTETCSKSHQSDRRNNGILNSVYKDCVIKNNDDCEDVIFVCEYKLNSLESTASKHQVIDAEKTADSFENVTEIETSLKNNFQSNSKEPNVTKNRKKHILERKNPVRKAHIDKVSNDLIEKLSYHPSVFNAKVKGRKPKQPLTIDQKNLRQSCRTTGAIYYPPSPLTNKEFKKWPETAQEMPYYNEKTHQIESIQKPILTPLKNGLFHNNVKLDKNLTVGKHTRCKVTKLNNFEKVMDRSLKNVLNYALEVKNMRKILKKRAECKTMFEKDAHGSHNNEEKCLMEEELFINNSLVNLIESTCILYSLSTDGDKKELNLSLINRLNEIKEKWDKSHC